MTRRGQGLVGEQKVAQWDARDIVWMLALGCAALYMYWPQLSEQAFFWFDALFQVCIRKEQGALALASGRIPLWDPTVYGGAPFLADPTNSVFYPFHFLLGLITAVAGRYRFVYLTYVVVAETLMCVWGTYWLSRRALGLKPVAACVSAATYTFSTAMVCRLVQYAHYTVMVMIPIVLLAATFLRRGGPRTALWVGLVWGVALLGDNQQYLYYLGLALGGYALYDLWVCWRSGESWTRLFVRYAVVGIVGLGVSAVLLLPVAEYSLLAGRAFPERSGTPVKYLLTYVVPDIFGKLNGGPGPYYGHEGFWNYWEFSAYVGIAGLSLAMVSCWEGWRHTYWRYVVGLCLVAWLLAFGVNNPLPELLPMGKAFRIPGKLLIFSAYSLAIMAGMGMDWLLRTEEREGRRRAVIVATVAMSVAWLASVVWVLRNAVDAQHAAVAWQGVRRVGWVGTSVVGVLWLLAVAPREWHKWVGVALVGLQLFDLIGYNRPFNCGAVSPEEFYASNPLVEYLQRRMKEAPYRVYAPILTTMNLRGSHFGLHTLDGFSALEPPWSRDLKVLTGVNMDRYLDLWNVVIAVDRAGRVIERTGALGRVQVVGALRVVEDGQVTNVLGAGWFNPRSEAIVTPAYTQWVAYGTGHAGLLGGVVRWEVYEPEYIAVSVTASAPAFAVFSESRYPGWQVRTNGAWATWFPVNHAFRAVAIPAGNTRIEWFFRPRSFTVGAVVSSATVVLVGGALAVMSLRQVIKRGVAP